MAPKPRRKYAVTIDPECPEAGNGGVIPPRETRWQPGQSGNPNGRPKGSATSFEKILEQELERRVEGDPTLDHGGRISRRRRLVRGLLSAVESGDSRAAKLLFDRAWPIVGQKDAPQPAVILCFDAQDEEA